MTTTLDFKPAVMMFMITFVGTGTVWIDGLEVTLDGEKFIDEDPQPLSKKELHWLRRQSIPFSSVKAETGLKDLKGFAKLAGDARIVALGEGTHGTSEFFSMKHRLLEYMVKEMGFRLFIIEDQFDACQLVNEYVVEGKGEIKTIMNHLMKVWQTQEVMNMVQWMRNYNQSNAGKPGFVPVQFIGMDMQYAFHSTLRLKEVLTLQAPEMIPCLDSVRQIRKTLWTMKPKDPGYDSMLMALRSKAQLLQQQLSEKKEQLTSKTSPARYEMLVQYGRIVAQNTLIMNHVPWVVAKRDSCMAANVEWIMAQHPGKRAVLWAHNYHIMRLERAAGSFLEKAYGAAYLPIAQTTYEGSFQDVTPTGVSQSFPLHRGEPGSYEYYFHQGIPGNFILDLRRAAPDRTASAWLMRPLEMRGLGIGGSKLSNQFDYIDITRYYDAVIFIDQSSPVQPLSK